MRYRRQIDRIPKLPTDRHFLSESCLHMIHLGLGPFRFTEKLTKIGLVEEAKKSLTDWTKSTSKTY